MYVDFFPLEQWNFVITFSFLASYIIFSVEDFNAIYVPEWKGLKVSCISVNREARKTFFVPAESLCRGVDNGKEKKISLIRIVTVMPFLSGKLNSNKAYHKYVTMYTYSIGTWDVKTVANKTEAC